MDRVTGNSIAASVLGANQQTLAKLANYQLELATNKKLNQVSDDPVAAQQSLRYRSESLQVGKYLDNVNNATSFMTATDQSLGQMVQLLGNVKSLAVQGTNGSQDASSRQTLAQSVDSLISQMIDLGNTVQDGRFIFGGTSTVQTSPPFARNAQDTGVTYSGNLDSFSVQIGPNSNVQVNTDGYSLLKGQNDVFNTLFKLRDALNQNDPTTVNSLLTNLDGAFQQVNGAQGQMGGRLQRLTLAQSQLEATQTNADGLVSQAEDADMTEVITQMRLTQTALQAGLQSGASVMQTTLLNFLK
jgi:flagellar hook-associated protein 3 FlgL